MRSHEHKSSHGSIKSYVVGYLLSLAFTLVPYYMVRSGGLTGQKLLITVLAFAFIQMFIQIFFFLHLGRGPKPFYNVIFFTATFSMILVVVFGSIFIMDNLYRNMSPAEVTTKIGEKEGIAEIAGKKTGGCQGLGVNHKAVIKDELVTPDHIHAVLCDTLTITNLDSINREITFGEHENHEAYGGVYEISLAAGRSKTITLNTAGQYKFHDHEDPTVGAFFTVEK